MQDQLLNRRAWLRNSFVATASIGTAAFVGSIGVGVQKKFSETVKHEEILLDSALKVSQVHNKLYDGHGISINFEFLKPGLFELSFRESNVSVFDPSKFGNEVKFRINKSDSGSEVFERAIDKEEYSRVDLNEFNHFLNTLNNHQPLKFHIEASYKNEERNIKLSSDTILF